MRKLSNVDVSEFMVKQNVPKEAELMQVALQRSAICKTSPEARKRFLT